MANGAGALVFPNGSTPADTARQKLGALFVNVIEAADDIQDINYTATNAICTPEAIVVRATGIIYTHDPDGDGIETHDGVATLVSQDGKCFRAQLAASAFVNVESIEDDLPGDAAVGDKFLVSHAPTGDFAANADDLCLITSAGPVFVNAVVGQRVYVRDEDTDYQYREDGLWYDVNALSDIGAQDLAFPFGMAVEDELTIPPDSAISGATGANIGDLTGGGNLAAAFDGTTSQAAAACATKAAATVGWIGKNYSASPKKINRAVVTPSNDQGFATGSPNITLELYGKNGSAPTDPASSVADCTLLGTSSSAADGLTARTIGCNAPNTEWDYVFVRELSSTSQTLSIAEVVFHTPTIVAAGVKYIAAVNAISAFAGHDLDVMDSNGDGTWSALTPYVGAKVYDRARGIGRVYRNSDWELDAIGYGEITDATDSSSATLSVTGAGTAGYTYNQSALPSQTSNGRANESLTKNVTADFAGQTIEFEYEADIEPSIVVGASTVTAFSLAVALFIDSETTPRRMFLINQFTQASGALDARASAKQHLFRKFVTTLADVSVHTAKIYFFAGVAGDTLAGGSTIVVRVRELRVYKRAQA